MAKNSSAQGTATHQAADDRLAGNDETASARDHLDVVVVGAGMAGLYALHKLRAAGLRAVALEAEAGVGGTWYRNRYPGARCDIESMFYSFSFSPELEQEWEWTEKFATQAEILRYLEHVADRFDLRRDVRTSTRVDSLEFDDDRGRWLVRTDTGAELDARVLHHRHRLPLGAQDARDSRGVELPWTCPTTPRSGRTTGSTSRVCVLGSSALAPPVCNRSR